MKNFRPTVSLLHALVARRRAQMSAPFSVLRATVLSGAPGWRAAADARVDSSSPTRLRRATSDAFIMGEGNCFTLIGLVDPSARPLFDPCNC